MTQNCICTCKKYKNYTNWIVIKKLYKAMWLGHKLKNKNRIKYLENRAKNFEKQLETIEVAQIENKPIEIAEK